MSETCCTRLAENTGRKTSPSMGTIAQLCRAISSPLRHVSTIGKKLVKQQYLLHMANFGLLAVEIGLPVWASLQISTGFASWQRYCTALWASAKLCGVEQRAPATFGRVAITLGIGPHSSFYFVLFSFVFVYLSR